MAERRVRIFGLGGVTLDEVHWVQGRVEPDEVCYIRKSHSKVGGMVATALIAAARLGAEVQFAGAVGDDDQGSRIRSGLDSEGVDTSLMQVIPGESSSFSVVLNALDHRYRTIANQKGVQIRERLPLDVSDAPGSADCCHLDGFWIESALEVAKAAKAAGVPVTLDVSQNQNDPRFDRLIGMADYFVPSERAAAKLSGASRVEDMARRFLAMGCDTVVITRGAGGVFAMDRRGSDLSIPAFPVEVSDTNGAGDTFHGALAFGVTQGWNLPGLLRFASAVAAIKCRSREPGNGGLPRLSDVLTFFEKHGGTFETAKTD
jgi:sulfofructose kinase